MPKLLSTLAEIGVTMSAVILLLLLLGPLLARRYPARWRYWAWLAVAVRLLLPVNLSFPAPPLQLEVPAQRVVLPIPPVTVAPVQASPRSEQTTPDPETVPHPGPITAPHSAPSIMLTDILSALWLLGALGLGLWYLAGWLRFARWVRRWGEPAPPAAVDALCALCAQMGIARPPRLLLCPGVGGPMLAGLLRPKLLLPQGTEHSDDLCLILRHELTHLKRRDIAYKTLLLLAQLVHWWNPLIWLMVRAAQGDLERVCDDAVTAALTDEERRRYGTTILAALQDAHSVGQSFVP